MNAQELPRDFQSLYTGLSATLLVNGKAVPKRGNRSITAFIALMAEELNFASLGQAREALQRTTPRIADSFGFSPDASWKTVCVAVESFQLDYGQLCEDPSNAGRPFMTIKRAALAMARMAVAEHVKPDVIWALRKYQGC